MTAVLRVMLVAALAASSIPAVAAAQGTPTDSLNRRVVLLERNIADLEQRVRALEALIRVEPSAGQAVPTSPKWQDLQNWRRLSIGMTMDEVRALLGEPLRVDAGYVTFWRWANASVTFISGRVDGWSEPSR